MPSESGGRNGGFLGECIDAIATLLPAVTSTLRIAANVNTVPIDREQSERSDANAFKMSLP